MRYILLIYTILILLCSPLLYAGDIKTVPINSPQEDKANTYRIILYGGNYLDDLETLAILDLEGDGFTIEPYVPDYVYTEKSEMSLKEALHYGESFVKDHPSFLRSKLKKIVDGYGSTLGYELRPLYNPLRYGVMDVLMVDYLKTGDRIIVNIDLRPSVERQIENEGDEGWIWGD